VAIGEKMANSLPNYHPFKNKSPQRNSVALSLYTPAAQAACDGNSGRVNGNLVTVSYLHDLYDDLVTAYPTYISKTILGKDQSDTYDIPTYTFTPENPQGKIIIQAGIHFEYALHYLTLYNFMREICTATTDSQLLYLKNNFEIIVIPCLNPWGLANSNRQNSRQVDLNRNADYLFSTQTAEIGDSFYQGGSAFSEKETQIMRDLLIANNDALLFADIHTEWYFNQLSATKQFGRVWGTDDDVGAVSWAANNYAHKLHVEDGSDERLYHYAEKSAGKARSYAYNVVGIPSILIEMQGDDNNDYYTSDYMTYLLKWVGNMVYSSALAEINS
jgi:hypothetical protein